MKIITPNWCAPSHITALSSTRNSGFSKPPYHSLNLGLHVGDDANTVYQNRAILAKQLNMPADIIWLNQIHSNVVINIDDKTKLNQIQAIDGDAIFTKRKNIACAIMSADCLPVLLTDQKGEQIAAIHVGWRGITNEIVAKTLSLFDGEILAWIAPAIGKNAFEIGAEVQEQLLAAFPIASRAIAHQAFIKAEHSLVQTNKESNLQIKWFANLAQLVELQLRLAGVMQIFHANMCTYSNAQDFFSYRRDGVTGRQASFIWIND